MAEGWQAPDRVAAVPCRSARLLRLAKRWRTLVRSQSKKEPGAFQFPAAKEPLLAPAGEPRPLICIHHALWISYYPPGATPPTSSASCLIDPAHHPPERLVVCQARPSPLASSVSAWGGPPPLICILRPAHLNSLLSVKRGTPLYLHTAPSVQSPSRPFVG